VVFSCNGGSACIGNEMGSTLVRVLKAISVRYAKSFDRKEFRIFANVWSLILIRDDVMADMTI
jgi:hypothetical protein